MRRKKEKVELSIGGREAVLWCVKDLKFVCVLWLGGPLVREIIMRVGEFFVYLAG